MTNEESKLEKKKENLAIVGFAGGALVWMVFAAYCIGVKDYRTWDCKKWPEIQEQRQMNYVREQFHKLDLDNNYVIDSTEFIYRE